MPILSWIGRNREWGFLFPNMFLALLYIYDVTCVDVTTQVATAVNSTQYIFQINLLFKCEDNLFFLESHLYGQYTGLQVQL